MKTQRIHIILAAFAAVTAWGVLPPPRAAAGEAAADSGRDAPRAVEALKDVPGILEVTMFGRAVHAMVEDQTAGEREIPERLMAAGHAVESIKAIEPSLEDVFVAFVHRSGGTVVG